MDVVPPQNAPESPPRTSGLSIVALILALLFFLPFVPLVGLVLGIVALVRTPPGGARGMAIAAIAVAPISFLFLQGICAAVAIPAFIKYTRRAKTVEATMNVRKLADEVISYYETQGHMPPSSDWTPTGTACGHAQNRFPPDPKAWAAPPWRELNFTVDDPHYYQYRVISSGNETVAIEARGDLDCDGRYSLFRRTLTRMPDGSLSSGAGLYTESEIE